jgi:hypothetical protein
MELVLPTAVASKNGNSQYQAAPLEVPLDKSDAQVVAARTIIGYGDSGLFKSTNARFFAQHIYKKTGKPVRLIAAEDSSKTIFEPLIEVGIVQAVFFTKAQEPLVTLRRLSRGEWPVSGADGKVTWVPLKPGEIGGYIGEGLTSMSEQLLEYCREKHLYLREQKNDAFEIGGEKFATASQTAFGFVQSEMLRAIKSFGMLPVDRVLWTAHETKGQEEDTKAAIRGPALVGTAMTPRLQKYCGVLLHFDGYPVEEKGKDGLKITRTKVRVWYQRHPDAQYPNISYPAKITLPVEMLAQLEKEYPGGFFEPTTLGGLDKFLESEARLTDTATDELRKWKAEVDAQRKAVA